jgi:hypothetical protein
MIRARSDFSVTTDTSNKQLAFVEHIVRALRPAHPGHKGDAGIQDHPEGRRNSNAPAQALGRHCFRSRVASCGTMVARARLNFTLAAFPWRHPGGHQEVLNQ